MTITGATTQGVTGATFDPVKNLDPETMILSLTFERTQTLEAVTRDQMLGMQQKNAQLRALNDLTIAARSADYTAPDTSDLKAVGEQMANWGTAGGRSWMSPDFKDTLDKYGIQNKSTNMSKAAMSTSSGGWTVSYPTDEYHALGQQVIAKAEELATPKADLNATMPGSDPPQTYADAFKAAGIPIPKDAQGNPLTQLSEDQMKGMIDNIQSKIDSVSSNSQLDMIRMQSLVNKRDQAVDLLTNLVAKFAKVADGITSNMR
jgi:hypothetical protein